MSNSFLPALISTTSVFGFKRSKGDAGGLWPGCNSTPAGNSVTGAEYCTRCRPTIAPPASEPGSIANVPSLCTFAAAGLPPPDSGAKVIEPPVTGWPWKLTLPLTEFAFEPQPAKKNTQAAANKQYRNIEMMVRDKERKLSDATATATSTKNYGSISASPPFRVPAARQTVVLMLSVRKRTEASPSTN